MRAEPERAEPAAHAAKACTICTLHFSEAKRGPGPGTSRLDFGGNPMTLCLKKDVSRLFLL